MSKHTNVRGRIKFARYRPLIIIISKFIGLMSRKCRKTLYIIMRNFPGRIGIAFRWCILKTLAKQCGDNVAIFPYVWLLHPEELEIGNNVSIQPLCYVECKGGVKIGNDVSIAHGVTIMSEHHNYEDKSISIRDQGISHRPIEIDSNVWIGAKATILGNIIINSGAIVGANSVVTHSIDKNCIVGEIPAKLIKRR